jgi:signal transduction histidine kinase
MNPRQINNQSIKIMNTTKQSIANKFAMSYVKGLLSRKETDAPMARLSAQIEYNQPSILDDLGVKTSGKKVIAEIIARATAVVKEEIRMQADKGEDTLKKAIAASNKDAIVDREIRIKAHAGSKRVCSWRG